MSDVQLRHVPDECRCIKLFELRRWSLLVVGCELVFKLCGRDIRAEPWHFHLLLVPGGILRGLFWIQRLRALCRGDLPSTHRPTHLCSLSSR